ncbi:MAG: hypothetical protein Mars2KO_41740 [Maribacter sp.]
MGIMLNSVATQMQSDYKGTLQRLKEWGYQYVEGDVYGGSLKNYASTLNEIGLQSLAHGGALGELLENYDHYLSVAETLKQKYVVCYYPWMVSNKDIDAEGSYEAARQLNKLGKRAKEAGFGFCWHPHNFEFKNVGNGLSPFSIIMNHTDPEYVSLQMDTYWMVKAGAKPTELLEEYPGRTCMFHLKDISDNGTNTCIGSGSIDFMKILTLAKSQGISYWTVEREQEQTTLICAKTASDSLKGHLK